MSFSFKCPACGVSLEAQDDWEGRQAPCPGCGKEVTITRQSAPAPAPVQLNVQPAPQAAAPAQPQMQPQIQPQMTPPDPAFAPAAAAPAGVLCQCCGKLNPQGVIACIACGSALQGIFYCEKCKARIDHAVQSCPACGGNVLPKYKVASIERKNFVALSLLLGWTGLPAFFIKRYILGLLSLLCGAIIVVALILQYSCFSDPWKEIPVTHLFLPACVAFLIPFICSLFIKTDGKGKKML